MFWMFWIISVDAFEVLIKQTGSLSCLESDSLAPRHFIKRSVCFLCDSQQDEEFQQLVLHLTQFRDRFCQQDLLCFQTAVCTHGNMHQTC